MSQSSEKIAQQYIDGGVIPAELVGQDGATKTYVDGQLEIIDDRIDATQSQIATNKTTMDAHIADSTVHVTTAEKIAYNNHIADTVIHTTQAEHDKLANIQAGAQVNQNAFSKVNSLSATNATDEFFIVGDIGITVTTNPITNEVRITATGSATPGAHATSHITGGTDVIPNAVTDGNSGLMSGSDAKFVRIEGETKSGSQSKADAALTSAQTYTDNTVEAVQTSIDEHVESSANINEPHGMRIRSGKLQYYNGTTWADVSSGLDLTTVSKTYSVNASTGSDSNDGLSAAQAFKTIGKAITVVPDVFNNSIVINVAAGTYTEDIVFIYNKFGSGSLTIQGPSSGSPAIISGRIEVSRSGLSNVSLNYLTVNPASGNNSISATYARLIRVNSCTMTATTSQSGVIVSYTDVEMYNCVISNKTQAIRSSSLSQVFSSNATGTGNSTGLYADAGGTIIKSGTQPSGTTAEFVGTGGLIRS